MSITGISDAAKSEIKSKSVLSLGDTVTGKPALVKSAIIEPVNVTVREINRIVTESNASLREAVSDVKKYAADNDAVLKTELRGEYIDKLNAQGTKLDACEKAANADKFVAEVVYNMRSATADINRGYPNGLKKGVKIEGLALSKYRYLVIDCQFDRNITLFMDLTDYNNPNVMHINSIAGCTERKQTYAMLAFEVIVDSGKTALRMNNALRSASYTSPSILAQDTDAYISKVTGII